MKRKIVVASNLLEKKNYGDYTFPIDFDYNTLFAYEYGFLDYHWHYEMTFSVILEGSMEYRVNDKIYEMKKGDGLFINSHTLHTAKGYNNKDCAFLALMFRPNFIFGHEESIIKTKYIDIIQNGGKCPSFFFNSNNKTHQKIMSLVLEANDIFQNKGPCYELLVKSKVCEIWSLFFNEVNFILQEDNVSNSNDVVRLSKILNFIHSNYKNKITLDDISECCNISKSECCRFFKKATRQTPFEYLLNYRIKKSIPLLLSDQYNITEISESVGFSNASYYTEIFKRVMDLSPTKYKKEKLEKVEAF